jgi:hypothetical protein
MPPGWGIVTQRQRRPESAIRRRIADRWRPGYNSNGSTTEASVISITTAGVVKNGVVVPNAPLAEVAFVEVHVINGPIEVPAELQAEVEAWQLASAEALELVERLAREGEADEKR